LEKIIAIGIMLTLLLTSIATLAFDVQPIKAGTITVPDDYPTIQQAINAASPGDAIFVRAGAYYECVIVNKTVSIVGESKESTVIDGKNIWTPVNIQANNVVLEGFRIQNSAGTSMMGGIIVYFANETIVRNNILINDFGEMGGIGLRSSSGSSINKNIIINSGGIKIWDSSNNIISENIIINNSYGIYAINPVGNYIYHNDFVNNTIYQVYLHPTWSGHSNMWDNGYPSGGNYWSNYTGTDEFRGSNQDQPGSDGIGDVPYVVDANNTDRYPLMSRFNPILLFPVPIYIRANGDVDPPIAPIQRNGDNYIFTDNITSVGDGIIVERDNVTIDGAGYTLQGLESPRGITLLDAGNVTIKNMNIRAFDDGIWICGSSNNNIYDNGIAHNKNGISVCRYSSHNRILRNNIANNDNGITLSWSSNNDIHGNNITIAINGGGILLAQSPYNNICNNFAGVYDISYGRAWMGIYLDSGNYPNSSSYNNIHNNTIRGILEIGSITLSDSSFNIISNNTITDGQGIWLWDSFRNIIIQNNINMTAPEQYWYTTQLSGSSNNLIYHNNFVANKDQMYTYNSENVWDNGYPSGGNYWSNYTGLDKFSGQNQDQLGSDGIGDTPYTIDTNNSDRYPLMKPWPALLFSDGFDYPVGVPQSQGGTGYVTEANDGDGYYNAQDFGEWNGDYGGYHLGEDWNGEGGGDTDFGDPVYAVSNGKVVYARDAGPGWGNVIIINHTLLDGSAVQSMYAHLRYGSLLVSEGNIILRGTKIGEIGKGYNDNEYAAHLHFEIRFPTCDRWGQPGPGYSSDLTGWTDPSNFIDTHRQLYAVYVDGMAFNIGAWSNSSISNVQINPDTKTISFNVEGTSGTAGFCNITIPKGLLWCDNIEDWTVIIDTTPVSPLVTLDGDYTYIYFTYTHSQKTVYITGTHIIPEFPSTLITPLFMALSIIAIIFTNKKRKNKGVTPKSQFL